MPNHSSEKPGSTYKGNQKSNEKIKLQRFKQIEKELQYRREQEEQELQKLR